MTAEHSLKLVPDQGPAGYPSCKAKGQAVVHLIDEFAATAGSGMKCVNVFPMREGALNLHVCEP